MAISAIYPGLEINKKKRTYNKTFSPSEQKEAVKHAGNNSFASAAEKYKVTEQTVRNWRKTYPEMYKKNKQ